MLFPIGYQISLFIFSLMAGVITGLFFDIYRLIRGVEKPGNIITVIEDILFWILTSILVFIFLLYTNYAYVSIYIYLLIFIGIVIYLRFLSNFCLLIIYNFSKYIFKFFRILIKYMLFPLELLIYNVKKVFNKD
ncbi:spore cortex biosynthesis protein YabQ [Hathewaya limosa]|uniref:Spore cortex biosynthesis protein YabQ n=1 Tax=Hathewaya limosa TaxID=1536 RepID=A0ABU0JNC8_HATLI|nr:spore cortex biosynthesis protein YabQ [Hathewaya limosa]MDQ0478579.1 spore cortex biosynthesis protein YabQ [Hathewaya limosa]